MPTPRASRLIKLVTRRFRLSIDDLVDLREAIDAHIRERVGVPSPTKKRTLYLPTDSLDDL